MLDLHQLKVQDPRQRQFLTQKTDYLTKHAPWWNPVREKLLRIGGEFAVFPEHGAPEFIPALLTRGRRWARKDLNLYAGNPNQCHQNCLRLWQARPDQVSIVTGFGLSPDAIWRQHSWLVLASDRRIVETTVSRTCYYGFEATRSEAQQWQRAWPELSPIRVPSYLSVG